MIIKQIIVRLDDDSHQKLKLKTIQDGITIQRLINEFVEIYLSSNETAKELLEGIKK